MFTFVNQYGSFPVPYSLYWLIVKQCGKNRFQAHKLFWDARDRKQPIGWIRKKIKEKWHVIDTAEMDYNKAAIESWVQTTIFHKKPVKKPTAAEIGKIKPDSLGDLLNSMGV